MYFRNNEKSIITRRKKKTKLLIITYYYVEYILPFGWTEGKALECLRLIRKVSRIIHA